MKIQISNDKGYKTVNGNLLPMNAIFAGIMLALICCQSCRKFLQIPAPTNQLVTASIFSNNATATSAITELYTKMWQNSTLIAINGQLADELKPNVTTGTYHEYYTNAMNNSATIYGDWNNYNSFYIYPTNAVIEGLQRYSGASPAVKQQLLGEAYFIRAFSHFDLTNQYGSIPLVLTTDFTITDQLPRTPRVQALAQVISDLNTAEGLLNINYVDGSDTVTTFDRVRPNKCVATALLARAYLYLGDYDNNNAADYQNAVTAATNVINNSQYSLCTNLSGTNSVFLKNSSEAIWQLATPLTSSTDTQDGSYFILQAAPSNIGSNKSNVVSPQLLNAFEAGDKRKTNWIGSITINGTTYNFPYKYKNNIYLGTEYTMVLRLAEQYLIRAEANAELGNTGAAISDLNVIRNRAGLAAYTGATDKASLLAAILHERQVELFTEWGHRWFDLCRAIHTSSTVNANTVMSVVTPQKGGTWSSDGHQLLFPIPLADILKDPNLTQNPGY